MSLLPILRYPDPRLKKVAGRVDKFDDSIRRLASDMAETMYEAPGIGLAATQVDVHKRVIVIDVSETRDQLLVLIKREAQRLGKQAHIVAHSEAVRELLDFYNMAAEFGDPLLIPASGV